MIEALNIQLWKLYISECYSYSFTNCILRDESSFWANTNADIVFVLHFFLVYTENNIAAKRYLCTKSKDSDSALANSIQLIS